LLDAVIESTEMMNRLIQDLLDVSVIESGHLRVDPQPQPLGPLVEHALAMLGAPASERQVELRSVIPTQFPDVRVDGTRFVQVLANLLGNAVKFSESGAVVTLVADSDGGQARIAVVDTGPGIPAHQLPHLFDRHWHAKRAGRSAGTGLGLAIARGIVEAHGGRIWVESREGHGSSFWFTVPVAGTEGAAPETERPSEATNS
jgi:signal transduction histidine kinase